MQIQSQCVSCLISRAFQEVQLATSDLDVQLKAMTEVVNILSISLKQGSRLERIPAYVGTRRDHIIQNITGCADPYAQLKEKSNEAALKLLPSLQNIFEEIRNPQQRFRKACMIASLGNIIEYGVAGHEIPWENLSTLIVQMESELAIDHIPKLTILAENAKRTLYLTDNAGEIVFDRLLIQALTELGSEVTVAVKGTPILNDATLSDARAAGLMEIAEIITTGEGVVGVLPQWCSQDFLTCYESADLVIAKGMGHHETLPEFTLPTSTAHLLRTKCEPVARSLKVPKDRNIVNVLIDHKGPLGSITHK
ncbi:MAG: DUF89 domain-containing protein [Candidatus Thorarchaeota archaeon]